MQGGEVVGGWSQMIGLGQSCFLPMVHAIGSGSAGWLFHSVLTSMHACSYGWQHRLEDSAAVILVTGPLQQVTHVLPASCIWLTGPITSEVEHCCFIGFGFDGFFHL
jgi:hypothetical protein